MKSTRIGDMSNIKLGDWVFYSDYGRFLNKEGKEFFIDTRLNKLLIFLINRKKLIVKRNEIIEYVWSDVQVNEENLTKGIFDLRKLLREYEITEIEITTIRNVGYRLQINEKEPKTKSILKMLLRTAMYLILIFSFLVMFIRAIRYED